MKMGREVKFKLLMALNACYGISTLLYRQKCLYLSYPFKSVAHRNL